MGEGEPCYIIAEAGVNHNGNIDMARKLIDIAKEAGADAVKFQTFSAEKLATRYAEKAKYQKETTGSVESQFEMIKKLELSEADFEDLFSYAERRNQVILSTACDPDSVDFLAEHGVFSFKIPSGEITNLPFLAYIARKQRPIILSTGMSTLGEIEEALRIIEGEGTKEVLLLHCVSAYPARFEDTNLRAIGTLRQAFKLPVGFSDHSLGITIPIAAAAMGACVIEKHFTLDKKLPGPDHRASLEPGELKDMVEAIRNVESAMGDGVKRPTDEEEETKKVARRSVVARLEIPEGAVITQEKLDILRPGTGIAPCEMKWIVGRKASRVIKEGELLTLDMMDK